MKSRRFVFIVIAVALSVAPQLVSTSSAAGTYSAKLISPRLGQVLYPGQHIRVEWQAILPKTEAGGCEMELWLSLDGGRTFTACITPHIDPHSNSFDWTVPNLPSNAAVLDIRFGCEWYYPETYAPQPASAFVISNVAPAS
ncbi:MAG TPA: hypothetical protein VH229_07450 [Candidatus Udaeobacter sp.]|nr:hypothetical protein [Candidatus Udaeobacter sp.]